MKNILLSAITATTIFLLPQPSFGQKTTGEPAQTLLGISGQVDFKEGTIHFTGNSNSPDGFAAPATIRDAHDMPVTADVTEQCFVDGECFGAVINNKSFVTRDHFPFSAKLVTKPASMNGAIPAKTLVSIIMDGQSYTSPDGSMFDETVQVELVLVPSLMPDTSLSSIYLLHNSTVYTSLKDETSKVRITDFTWADDGRSFNISIDFNCTMRSWEYASTGEGEVNLKGKMSKIHVTLPGRVTASK